MKKKIISAILSAAILFGTVSFMIPVACYAEEDVNKTIIEQSEIPLRLYYDEEASHGVDDGYDEVSESFGSSQNLIDKHVNDDWERWSIPLGNGYFGANVFGRTYSERIQITEKTLANPYYVNSVSMGGLNNFSETYIDFLHASDDVTDYSRELDLKTAISTVQYTYEGVTYTREYFTSYPDRALIIRLDASESGKLGFVLRPTIPYEQSYMNTEGDGGSKEGTVESYVEDGVGHITLSGTLGYFGIDFVGLYTVYTDGGEITASTAQHTYTDTAGVTHTDTDGTIVVSDATSAYIVITLGTDYVLSEETFTSSKDNKPTQTTTLDDAMATVGGYQSAIYEAIDGLGYEESYATLKQRHIEDYSELFGRVSLDLNCNESDFALTTDVLLENYKNGSGSTYLEVLYFQYGRYLLIASSRSGALPANLQGTWNRYNKSPWSSGYWHNINVQMNYWPAFTTNLAETFESYVEYNDAYMAKAEQGATSTINSLNPSVSGTDGGNGWSIDTGAYPNDVYGSSSIGNLGFTTQLFWEYYEYSQDESILRDVVYPVLVSAARFITKAVSVDEDGNYLAIRTDSPEQYVNGVWYYTTGTTYAQSFAYQNNYNTLLAAKELGIDFSDESGEDYEILMTVLEQIDKYDPIIVGLSGQVKEFREEEYYGDLGEYNHRHISQLVGLYPGNIINSSTPAWLDAAKYTLTERGSEATGWGLAHRINLWARTKDGDTAYEMYQTLLSDYTATNLWDLHPPFQIDGNLGGTAGVAEMLLQSHEGYIEPLAALPSAWSDGSYTGLVARGDFEVSAAWTGGVATTFNITSGSGAEAKLCYEGITQAVKVVDAETNKLVEYTYEDDGLISFDTEAGKTYIIYGFVKVEKPDAVSNLECDKSLLDTSTLTWSASSDAVCYNVYVAVDSASDYTLVGTTTDTSFSYYPEAANYNSRTTYAVCAVSADGVESERALAYSNPDGSFVATIYELGANVLTDGTLQVTVNASDYASKFRLYSRASSADEWQLVCESTYPIIITDEYDTSLIYGVSAICIYDGTETDVSTIGSYNQSQDTVEFNASNLFEDKTFIPTSAASAVVHAAAYGYPTLTDGSFDNTTGRFSTKTATTSFFDATVTLEATYLLGELRIYDFQAYDSACKYLGQELVLSVLCDGVWTDVYHLTSNTEILTYRKTVGGVKCIAFDLTGVEAQAIRLYMTNPVDGCSISIYEIECTGVLLPSGKLYSNNLLLGKTPVTTQTNGTVTVNTYGTYGFDKLTDGSCALHTGRFSINALADNYATVVYDLGDEAVLETLTICDHAEGSTPRSNETTIELFVDGKWVTYLDAAPLWQSTSELTKCTDADSSGTAYETAFDLTGYTARLVRITFKNTANTNGVTIYEIKLSGYASSGADEINEVGAYYDNLLLGKTFTGDATPISSSNDYGYSNLTDGDYQIHTGRFALTDGTDSKVTMLCYLGAVYELDTLRIFDFYNSTDSTRCNEVTVEVLSDGEWIKIHDAAAMLYGSDAKTDDSEGQRYTPFDMGGICGDAIRITCFNNSATNTTSGSGSGISLYEIKLSGIKLSEDYGDWNDNVFLNREFVAASGAPIWTGSYANLTDGDSSNSSRLGTSSPHWVDGTLDFDGEIVKLYTLTINYDAYNAKRCGSSVLIEVYRNGAWSTAAEITHTATVTSETVELEGVEAEKVRIYIPGPYTATETGDCIVLWEISCTGYAVGSASSDEDTESNVLLDSTVTSSVSGHPSLPVTNVVDGNTSTRYAVLNDSGYTYYLTLELNYKAPLYTLRIYDFKNTGSDLVDGTLTTRSDDTSIEVYVDGEWIKLYSGVSMDVTSAYTEFDLHGVVAGGVRITFNNTNKFATASIYEITCTTGAGEAVDRAALLEAYSSLCEIDMTRFNDIEAHREMLAEFRAYVMNVQATQDEVDSFTTAIVEYLNEQELSDADSALSALSLVISGNIGLNFHFTLAEGFLTSYPDAYIEVTMPNGEVVCLPVADAEQDADGRYVFTAELVAAKMSDAVSLRMVYGDGIRGISYARSVRDYADAVFADSATYEAAYPGITDLLYAMLNYGGYAQKYFGYNTDNLANVGLYDDATDPVLSDMTLDDSISVSGAATGASLSNLSLSLNSATAVNIYLSMDSSYSVEDYKFTVTLPDGRVRALAATESNGVVRVCINSIPATYVDEAYTLKVTNVTDGTVCEIECSATCYIAMALNTDGVSDSLVSLVKALKLYADAADAYNAQ